VNDGGKSHGTTWGDYDNDGNIDVFVGNIADQNNFSTIVITEMELSQRLPKVI